MAMDAAASHTPPSSWQQTFYTKALQAMHLLAKHLTQHAQAYWDVQGHFKVLQVRSTPMTSWGQHHWLQEQHALSFPNPLLRHGQAQPLLSTLHTSMNLPLAMQCCQQGLGATDRPWGSLSAFEEYALRCYLKEVTHAIAEALPSHANEVFLCPELATPAPLFVCLGWHPSEATRSERGETSEFQSLIFHSQLPLYCFLSHEDRQALAPSSTSTPAPVWTPNDWHHLLTLTPASIGPSVCLRVGTCQLRMQELDQLEVGDLLVMEASQLNQLWLIHANLPQPIPFSIVADWSLLAQHPPLALTPAFTDYVQEAPLMNRSQVPALSTQANPALHHLWNDLTVDVQVEFEAVKIPLSQLKHLSAGEVVQVGHLLNNTVHIKVNNNVIAHGELVVVGEQYGVLLTALPHAEAHVATAPVPELPHHAYQPASSATHGSTSLQAGVVSPTLPLEHQEHPAHTEEPHEATQETYNETDYGTGYAASPPSPEFHPALLEMAEQYGLDLTMVHDAAHEQGITPNEALRQLLEQNSLLDPDTDYSLAIEDTDAMMSEVDQFLNPDDY